MEEREFGSAVEEKRTLRHGAESPFDCIFCDVKSHSPAQKPSRPHYHEYIEFLFGLPGCDVIAWIAGKNVPLRGGDLLVINSGVAHTFSYLAPVNRYYCVKVLPEVIYFPGNPEYDTKYVIPFLRRELVPDQRFSEEELRGSGLDEAFAEIRRLWETQEYGYEIALKARFLDVFLWIIRYNHRSNRLPAPSGEAVSLENARMIQKSVSYIGEHYADVSETSAAAVAGMSRGYYSRMFRAVVGKGFQSYLNAVRINEAEHLLLTTDLPVTEIACAVGYGTSSHFIEHFRAARHETPKQYRLRWNRTV